LTGDLQWAISRYFEPCRITCTFGVDLQCNYDFGMGNIWVILRRNVIYLKIMVKNITASSLFTPLDDFSNKISNKIKDN
jgi:hypothetical protein